MYVLSGIEGIDIGEIVDSRVLGCILGVRIAMDVLMSRYPGDCNIHFI